MSEQSSDEPNRARRNIKPRKEPILEETNDAHLSELSPISSEDLPAEIVLKRLRQLGLQVNGCGPNWQSICPAHSDTQPSLSITETKDGVLLMHCHAGCQISDVLASLGLEEFSLYPSLYALQFSERQPQGHMSFHCRDGFVSHEPEPIDATQWKLRLAELRRRENLSKLAKELRLAPESLNAIQVGYDCLKRVAYFPEWNDRADMVGLIRRDERGNKRAMPASLRGLTLARYENGAPSGPVYVAEGATDTAALHMAGVFAIGRSTAKSSYWERNWLLCHLRRLNRRKIIVLGDRDSSGAGARGAEEIADYLAAKLKQTVWWALPQDRFKDVREQVTSGCWNLGLVLKEVRA